MADNLAPIQTCPLFSGLAQEDCVKIASYSKARTFARDEMLYMQGQPVRYLTLIRSGSIKITQLSPSGNEVILWMYGSGNVVGVLSEPSSSCHNCSARAMNQCSASVWEYSTIQKLKAEYPQISLNMSKILYGRLNELEERFREVATEKVSTRLALALVRLQKQIGKQVRGGVEVSLSREELAQMTGTTLFTISRILSKWGDAGFVIPRREAIVVCDPRRLELAGVSGA